MLFLVRLGLGSALAERWVEERWPCYGTGNCKYIWERNERKQGCSRPFVYQPRTATFLIRAGLVAFIYAMEAERQPFLTTLQHAPVFGMEATSLSPALSICLILFESLQWGDAYEHACHSKGAVQWLDIAKPLSHGACWLSSCLRRSRY